MSRCLGGYWLGRSNGPTKHYTATTGAVRSHVQNSSETPGKPWFGVITSAMEGWGAGAPNPPVPASGPGILRCVGAAASAELPPAVAVDLVGVEPTPLGLKTRLAPTRPGPGWLERYPEPADSGTPPRRKVLAGAVRNTATPNDGGPLVLMS